MRARVSALARSRRSARLPGRRIGCHARKHRVGYQPFRTERPARSRTTPSGRASLPAPRKVLLDRGDDPDDEHPGQAAEADGEHHQHQRPAAADAEQAVGDAQAERFTSLGLAAPAVEHEPERRPAFVETPVLQRGELVRAGDYKRRDQDVPRVRRRATGWRRPTAWIPRSPTQASRPIAVQVAQVPDDQQADQEARLMAPSDERTERRD